MTLRSSPSRSNSRRCRSTARRSPRQDLVKSHAVARPAGGKISVAVQDRLDDVLQARCRTIWCAGSLPAAQPSGIQTSGRKPPLVVRTLASIVSVLIFA